MGSSEREWAGVEQENKIKEWQILFKI